MDDLDILTHFRADLPGPSSEAERRSRARLLTLATHPGDAGRRPVLRPGRGPVLRRRAALAGGAAVLALSLAVTGGTIPFARHGAESAAAVLDAAARTAAARPDVNLQPGQFYYQKRISADTMATYPKHGGAPIAFLQKGANEWWVASDRSGVSRNHSWYAFFHPGDLARLRAAGLAMSMTPRVDVESFPRPTGSGDNFDPLLTLPTPRQLRQLPTAPTALRRLLRARLRHLESVRSGRVSLECRTFYTAANLLLAPGAPPALQAALFQVVKSIPGVDLLGRVTDPAGRPGTGVGLTQRGVRTELIFDRATARGLAWRTVIVDPQVTRLPWPRGGSLLDLPKGTVIGYYAILAQGVVDSDSARP